MPAWDKTVYIAGAIIKESVLLRTAGKKEDTLNIW
jgi:hypothetical protein